VHGKTHWGTQVLTDQFLRNWGCIGIYGIVKQIMEKCAICQKVNRKVMRKAHQGGQELVLQPFQSIQVDFTELPQVQWWKYLLVIVDHLAHWVEAMPVVKATANVVCKTLVELIIPWNGMVNHIDSDRGTHFTSKILQEALGIKWELRTARHPQSSGQVERMNQTLKRILTKLMTETQMSWIECLPLPLLRTQPRSDLKVSPYEMMFGLPFLTPLNSMATYEEEEDRIKKYILSTAQTLEELREKGRIPRTAILDFKIHSVIPGDWVMVKSWKD
ncbi:TF28 protein, partial [Urocynchramus pylzowi]|nr:TF28 protein [Urocynchramus pylzowi]